MFQAPGVITNAMVLRENLIFHRFKHPLTHYPTHDDTGQERTWSSNKLKSFTYHHGRKDVFVVGNKVPPNGNILSNNQKFGISLFIVVNPAASEYAHQRISANLPKPVTCLVSNQVAQIPNTELFYDFSIKTPDEEIVANHVLLVPTQEYPLTGFQALADCSGEGIVWTVCQIIASGEKKEIELPDINDREADCAYYLMEAIIQGDFPPDLQFEAALFQYILSTNNTSNKNIVRLSGGRFAELMVLGQKYFKAPMGIYDTIILNLAERSQKYLLCRGAFSLHLQDLNKEPKIQTEHWALACRIQEILMVNGYSTTCFTCVKSQSYVITCFTEPPVDASFFQKLDELQFEKVKFVVDGVAVGDDALPDLCVQNEINNPHRSEPYGLHYSLWTLQASSSKKEERLSIDIDEDIPVFWNMAVRCNGIYHKGTPNERRCLNKTLKSSGLCYMHN